MHDQKEEGKREGYKPSSVRLKPSYSRGLALEASRGTDLKSSARSIYGESSPACTLPSSYFISFSAVGLVQRTSSIFITRPEDVSRNLDATGVKKFRNRPRDAVNISARRDFNDRSLFLSLQTCNSARMAE